MRTSPIVLALLLAFCCGLARADEYEFDDDDAAGPPVAEESVPDGGAPPNVFDLSRAAFAEQAVLTLFARKQYDQAAQLLERALYSAILRNATTQYNLACALARLGKTDEALGRLQKAIEYGFRDAAHLKVDDDLASLRGEARFKELVKQAAEAKPVEPPAAAAPRPGGVQGRAGAGLGRQYGLRPADQSVSVGLQDRAGRHGRQADRRRLWQGRRAARPMGRRRHRGRQSRRSVRQPRPRPLIHELQELSAAHPGDL